MDAKGALPKMSFTSSKTEFHPLPFSGQNSIHKLFLFEVSDDGETWQPIDGDTLINNVCTGGLKYFRVVQPQVRVNTTLPTEQ